MKKCEYAKVCGGCQLQHLTYKEQLWAKQEKIEKLLSKFCNVNKIIGMDDPLHYRNKLQVSFAKDESGKVVCGNFVPSTHIIVPVTNCMITDEKSLEIINYFKELVIKYHLSIFDENALKGCIRHLQVRCTNLNEYMLIIVTGSNIIPNVDSLVKDITRRYKEIKTIVQNINRKHTSMVLGDRNIVIYGKGYIEDVLCGNKYRLSPSSFYQVNKRQTEILYNTALNLVNFDTNETIVDAYCGIGTIGLSASKKVSKVIGVELNRLAIKDAIRNAKINKIENVVFVSDDAGRFMSKLAKEKAKIDTVIMDPPRSGADEKFLKSLCLLKPRKILYISCGPESLRNNIKYLIRNEYKVEVIQPVDMFPYTEHVETIVYMSKNNV